MGYGPWGHKESDMTERLSTYTHTYIYVCVYIYIYIYTHTHTHTHMNRFSVYLKTNTTLQSNYTSINQSTAFPT